MASILDQNLSYFNERLSEVPLKTEPYSYLVIPEAFHPNFYDFLVYLENSLYHDTPENYHYMKDQKASYSDGRYMWSSNVTQPPRIIEEVMKHLNLCFLLLQEKFERHFFVSEQILHFVRDKKGYSIAPHTDARKKVLTTLLYMPEENGLPLHGTDVCVPKDPSLTSNSTKRFSEDQFEIVDGAPFEPNTMFAFVRADNSFHSSKLQTADLTRKSMMFVTYGVPDNG